MKKFLTLTIALLSIFALAACGEDEGDRNHLEEARDRLVLSVQRDSVKGDVDLPDSLANYPDVEITWESSDSDVIENDGSVHRPENGEGDVNATVTATLSYEGLETTRSFDLTIKEMVDSIYYDDFSQLYEDDVYGEIITIEGIVTSRFSGGAFLYDGDTHFAIYDAPNYEIGDLVVPGDHITYTGEYSTYNTLHQITNREEFVNISSDNDYDVDVTEVSVDDLYNNYDPDDADQDIHGQHFTVEGYLTQPGGEGSTIYLESLSSDEALEFYEYTMQPSLDALEQNVGEVVELEVVYYALHGSGYVRVIFQGNNSDIAVQDVSDQEKLDLDLRNLENQSNTGEDVTLPESGENFGTQYDNWTSDNTDIFQNDGTFVALPTTPTVVTFTADATNGSETDTATIEVEIFPEPMNVSEARQVADDGSVYVEGVVTSFPVFYQNSGFFIQDDDGTGIMIRSDLPVEIGDKVRVTGKMSYFEQYQGGNTLYRVEDANLVENLEGDHDVFVVEDATANDVATGFGGNQSQRYRLENVTVDEVSSEYNTVYITTGEDYRLRYDIRNYGPEIGSTVFEAGDTIEWIEFTVYEVSFDDIMIEYVEGKDFEPLDTEITVE